MRKFRTLFSLLFLVSLSSCKDGNKVSYKPASIGAINSLAVVMDTELWKGKVGDKVREHFAAPVIGLPWTEPIFSIEHMPPKVFTGTIRNRRSVLYIQKDTLDLAHIKTDMYATPQRVGVIKGRTEEEIIENLEIKADEIIATFKSMELAVKQKGFLKSLNKAKVLQEKFGITLNVPSIYKVGKQEDNFVWIDRQIPKGTINIIAYEVPGNYFKNDSTWVGDFVRMRDSIGKKHIPGPTVPGKITYMRTEPAFSPSIFHIDLAEKEVIEVKGIWDIKNYPMAGPFISYIIPDKDNDRVLILEGFVFAPATEKRDNMFELEAILKTVRFNKKTK